MPRFLTLRGLPVLLRFPALRRLMVYVAAGTQDALEYWADYLIRTVLSLTPLFVDALVWVAVFGSRPGTHIGLYDLPRLLSYMVAAQMTLQLVDSGGVDGKVAQDIRDGMLSAYLLRPMGNLEYRLATAAGRKLAALPGLVLPFVVIFVVFRGSLGLQLKAWRFGVFPISLIMAAILNFVIDYLIGISCFWVLEISALFFVKNWIAAFLAGSLVPVDLFPGWLGRLAATLPFRFVVDFPVRVLVGIAAPNEVRNGLLCQAVWVCAVTIAVRLAWRLGLRRYEAVGG